MSDMDQIVKEFLVESYENLDQLDRDLVRLEEDPHDGERLASIFRTIHTIKGTSGFFGFSILESVTHVGENLLCKLREGQLSLSPEITSGLLAMVDAVREMLANVESSGAEGEAKYGELIELLTRLHAEENCAAAAQVAAHAETTVERLDELMSEAIEPAASETASPADAPAVAASAETPSSGEAPATLLPPNMKKKSRPRPAARRPKPRPAACRTATSASTSCCSTS